MSAGGMVVADVVDERIVDHALGRATGAALVGGNRVRILKDAAEHYPAWLAAIAAAERTICFETYIMHEDASGDEFAAALSERARAGVRVRLIYDWWGGVGNASRRFWRRLRDGGVEVRCFNPPSVAHPLGWLTRDHRKMLSVDGRVGFVTGLCVGRMWVGDPSRDLEPWRDTGVEVGGPAVAEIERAFARVWTAVGGSIGPLELRPREAMRAEGDVALRVVAGEPGTAGMLRADQLMAAVARERVWLADAYFAGMPAYVQALCAAARDGVDVRLLVPGASDIPWLHPISQAGYRPLLRAGVRVYEWNGAMMHAKTAVSDGWWARVGSSNLNFASGVGNFELDVVLEDARTAAEMEQLYLDDLEHATELVLTTPRGSRAPAMAPGAGAGAAASRAAAGALRLGRTFSAVLGTQRVLGPLEAPVVAAAGLALLIAAVVILRWPLVVAVPAMLAAGWMGLALLARAYTLQRAARPSSKAR